MRASGWERWQEGRKEVKVYYSDLEWKPFFAKLLIVVILTQLITV